MELAVAMAVIAILAAVSAPSLREWQDKVDVRNAVSAVADAMVESRARAVVERRTYTVSVDYAAETWRVVPGGGASRARGGVDLYADASDPDCPPLSAQDVLFRPNGTADAAGFEAVYLRSANPRVAARYRVKVLGATGKATVEGWTEGSWVGTY